MAYTTTQLQALQDALASGELKVEFNGRSVTYRSVDELKKAISTVEASLAAAGNTVLTRQVRIWADKGF